jgi:hypothetical protein
VSRLYPSLVLGYHGCDKTLGLDAINGRTELRSGDSPYDWLGQGVYFWENDVQRALEWAKKKAARGACKEPYVIGAVIYLGNCLDLLVRENADLIRDAYESFKLAQEKANLKMPINKKAPKDNSDALVMRYLDCAVINHLHSIIDKQKRPRGLTRFDTVRGVFTEGKPIFDGSKLSNENHAQIAVRNVKCIRGVFIPSKASFD